MSAAAPKIVRVCGTVAATAAVAAVAAGCGATSAAPEVCGKWNVSHTSADLQFLSVVSPSNVWAAGGGAIQHWDGSRWKDAGGPDAEGGIAALGPDDVWAASLASVAHRTGGHWHGTDAPGGVTGTNEYTLFARGPSDAWLTWREDYSGGVDYGGIEHWNGKRWIRFPQTALTGVMDQARDWLATSRDGDIWAGGSHADPELVKPEQPTIERWDGGRWRVVPVPKLQGQYLFDSIAAVDHDDAWVAGTSPGTNSGPLDSVIEHWDGKRWTVTPTGFPASGEFIETIKDIAASPTRAWAVGAYAKSFNADKQPLLLTWNGKRWRRVNVSSWGGTSLASVAALPSGDAWVVGDEVRAHFKPCRTAR